MKKILLTCLVASIMFGADAKPINDGPYVLQDNASSPSKNSFGAEKKSVEDDLKAIKDYLELSNKTTKVGKKEIQGEKK